MKNNHSFGGIFLGLFMISQAMAQSPTEISAASFPYKNMPEILPGTKLLDWQGDLSTKMLDGAHQFIDEKIRQSVTNRSQWWNRNFSSRKAYELSVDPNRQRLMEYIGVEDKSAPIKNYNQGLPDKNPPVYLERMAANEETEIIAETSKYRVYAVRWSVLNRVYGEGLLLQPKTKPAGNIIAIPDADQIPEQLVGLSPGIPVGSQFARQL